MLAVTLATMGFSIYLYVIVPKGFFPQQDTGRLSGNIQASQDISYQAMRQKLAEVAGIVQSDPAVDTVMGFSGGGGGSTTNTGRMFISLKPLGERQLSADQVIARLRGKLAKVPGAPTYLQAVQDLRIGGRASSAQYQYTLQSVDLAELNTWAPKVERKLRTLSEIADVNSDQQDKGIQSLVVFDRGTASRLGLSPQLIDDTLYDAFGQRQVSIMYTPLNQYHVVMEVAPQFWQSSAALNDIYVRSPTGMQVPLSAVARYEPTSTLLSVNHQGQFPGITLSFNMAPGVSLGEAVQTIEKSMREIGLPGEIRGSFQGTAKAFQVLAGKPAAADPCRTGHGLHRARDPLRELYPPAHDSVHDTVRGSGRVARAAPLQDGAEHDRADRHHSPDRDCEEERHHDDRLCAGCGAEGRETAGGGDL